MAVTISEALCDFFRLGDPADLFPRPLPIPWKNGI